METANSKMTCPFCGQAMRRGVLSGDGRSRLIWQDEGRKLAWAERLTGKGRVTAARYRPGKVRVDAYFCKPCGKMILETDVSD